MNTHLEHLISRWGAAPLFALAVTSTCLAALLINELVRWYRGRL